MEKDHYEIGVCRICKVSDCLKNGLCPICSAKQGTDEVPDILKEMFRER